MVEGVHEGNSTRACGRPKESVKLFGFVKSPEHVTILEFPATAVTVKINSGFSSPSISPILIYTARVAFC